MMNPDSHAVVGLESDLESMVEVGRASTLSTVSMLHHLEFISTRQMTRLIEPMLHRKDIGRLEGGGASRLDV